MLIVLVIPDFKQWKLYSKLSKGVSVVKLRELYNRTITHLKNILLKVDAKRIVYFQYDPYLSEVFDNENITVKELSTEEFLVKLSKIFRDNFEDGYRKIIFISSDCMELEATTLEHAFKMLNDSDAVIGPALDGSYYLLGLSRYFGEFFEKKEWNSEKLLHDTLEDFNKIHVKYNLLPALSKIDEI